MKGILYHISVIIVALTTLTACSKNDSSDDGIGVDDLRVAFTLTMNYEQTRASDGWGDYSPTDAGTEHECAINPSDIYIKLCDASGRVIGNVEDLQLSRISQSQYAITGVWLKPGADLNRAKKVMIFANCGIAAKTNDIADISFNLTDTHDYIPMWGVTSVSTLQLGKSNDIGSIALLRATAKVGVELRDDMAERGYSIGTLQLNGYNTMGYVLPLNYNQVAKTEYLKFEGTLHPLYSKAADWLDFSQTGFCYIPEYNNTSADASPSQIVVELMRNGSYEGTYHLAFCSYNNGDPSSNLYDIQRNHYYRFVIYKEDDRLMVSLHVRDWFWREHEDVIM